MNERFERVTVLRQQEGQPQRRPEVIAEGRQPRRKRPDSGYLQWIEDITRTTARSTSAAIDTYVRRHDRSNRRGRDGWLRDLPGNVWTAVMQGKRRFWKVGLFDPRGRSR